MMSGTSAEKAREHKDKLIQYDRTTAKRTKVIDDQTDYFNVDSNKFDEFICQ